VLTMNSVKILHAVRSAITAIAELLVNLALSRGFLSVHTRNRRLCELLFKERCINPRFE